MILIMSITMVLLIVTIITTIIVNCFAEYPLWFITILLIAYAIYLVIQMVDL